jgi:uncharacterized protein
MKGKGHIPIRTCISCGAKREKGLLLRLSNDNENRLIKDTSFRIFGRGAYVCNMKSCMERLLKNKRLNKQFRTDMQISISNELMSDISSDNIKSIYNV